MDPATKARGGATIHRCSGKHTEQEPQKDAKVKEIRGVRGRGVKGERRRGGGGGGRGNIDRGIGKTRQPMRMGPKKLINKKKVKGNIISQKN